MLQLFQFMISFKEIIETKSGASTWEMMEKLNQSEFCIV